MEENGSFKLASSFSKRILEEITSGSKMDTALNVAGLIGVTVIVAAFARKLMEAFDKLGIMAMEPIYYKKMLKSHPRLMEEDPDEVAKLWSTLYKSSPHLAQDPVAAGAFIIQNIQMGVIGQYGGPPLDTYKTLSGIDGSFKNNRSPNSSGDSLGSFAAEGLLV